MSDAITGAGRKPRTVDEYDAPTSPAPGRSAQQVAPDAPWLKDPAFGSPPPYSPSLFANPALRVAAPSTRPQAPGTKPPWPQLPPMPSLSSARVTTSSCAKTVAATGNAHVFADRGVPLSVALKDGAFDSPAELERFIDEYLAYTAGRPEMRALHEEAKRAGPEILAGRLEAEDREAERALEEQRMHDRMAPLRVRPPLPLQQRAAVGEVAIPIAKAVTTVAKFVPYAGELVILAEVATGRGIMGLGERLDDADRAIDAAMLVAPFAAKALGKGVRGAAELLRMSRATGRSVEECRAVCRTALTVEKNRAAVRDGIAAAKAGRALTTEQRAGMQAVGSSAESLANARTGRARSYKPTVKTDASLPAGEGWTDKYGNVSISPHGTAKERALAFHHEAVHSFFSPKALNSFRELRANVGMAAYNNSALCKYIEEALAESYAQVRVNGIRALPDGLSFPIRNGYVTLRRVVTEGAIGSIAYGGVLYGVYAAVDDE